MTRKLLIVSVIASGEFTVIQVAPNMLHSILLITTTTTFLLSAGNVTVIVLIKSCSS